MEAVAVNHLSVAERDHLHRGLVAVDRQPDDVHGPDGSPVRRLPLDEVPHREETVPIARGLLEALVVRGPAHALLELALDPLRAAGEEADAAVADAPALLPAERPGRR